MFRSGRSRAGAARAARPDAIARHSGRWRQAKRERRSGRDCSRQVKSCWTRRASPGTVPARLHLHQGLGVRVGEGKEVRSLLPRVWVGQDRDGSSSHDAGKGTLSRVEGVRGRTETGLGEHHSLHMAGPWCLRGTEAALLAGLRYKVGQEPVIRCRDRAAGLVSDTVVLAGAVQLSARGGATCPARRRCRGPSAGRVARSTSTTTGPSNARNSPCAPRAEDRYSATTWAGRLVPSPSVRTIEAPRFLLLPLRVTLQWPANRMEKVAGAARMLVPQSSPGDEVFTSDLGPLRVGEP